MHMKKDELAIMKTYKNDNQNLYKSIKTGAHTDTHTQSFDGLLTATAWVGRYQKKHSPTHTHPDHQTFFINYLHLLRSAASSLFS